MGLPPHWADEAADRVLGTGPDPEGASAPAAPRLGPHRISTGISPSGPIHVGNLRETLTGDAVARVLRERGADVRLEFVADDFDPLRRVYPFLDARVYEPLIGRPLSEIPCPCGEHASYADHFLRPYLETLKELAIDLHLERGSEMYKSGRMNKAIVRALEERDRIAAILQELTGRKAEPDWSPFNPLCPACKRISAAKVLGFSGADETVSYACACGSSGTIPMTGGGKLTWRVDWPARWWVLGVTVEPFGKDHASRGGSYDSGVRIVREVFGYEPPFPIPYEWIGLKGMGDMSSSKGNVVSVADALQVVPPDVLRYMVLRTKPMKAITFDPGLPLLSLIDEYDDAEAKNRDDRSIALSRASGWKTVGVPFKHLVVVLQIAGFDLPRAFEILKQNGYHGLDREAVTSRFAYATRWLERFAPEDIKFALARELPPEARALDGPQREFLRRLAARLTPGATGEEIHALVYDVAKGEFPEVPPPRLFEAIYLALVGRTRGPRAGAFIAFVGEEFAKKRFLEAAEAV